MNALVNGRLRVAEYVAAPSSSNHACWEFDAACAPLLDAPAISTGLKFLAGAGEFEQLYLPQNYWVSSTSSQRDFIGETDALMVRWLDESECDNLTAAAERIYTRLLGDMQALGFNHLVRVWNYFADINGDEAGLERYRHFCRGRFDALAAFNIGEADFPSACALGHQGGQVLVYAWVSKRAPRHYENPAQQAAYQYPDIYGPRSPSFARASVHDLAGTAALFLSGTASVVGHETACVDDLAGQLRTTFHNIDTLLAHIAREEAARVNQTTTQWRAEVLKIYIRAPEDLAQVQAAISEKFGEVPAVYVHADVCRADLLFEMDGIWIREQ